MSHMYCPECGERIEYSIKKPNFCPFCGAKVNMSASIKEKNQTEDAAAEKDFSSLNVQFTVDENIGGTIKRRSSLQDIINESKNGNFVKSGKRKQKSSMIDPDSFNKQMLEECSPVKKSKEIFE